MFFTRRIRITKLLRHLQTVEAGLRGIAEDRTVIPSPAEMESLTRIRYLLRELSEQAETCEAEFWGRIRKWQDTPYTPRERFTRSILAFFGWWVAGTLTISYSIMGWFIPLFEKPWHIFIVSAVLAFIIVAYISYREYHSKQ